MQRKRKKDFAPTAHALP
ncbi:hypothetical protein D047_2386A, partial [Vibrio parahaemolyticus VPTS-2010_2]